MVVERLSFASVVILSVVVGFFAGFGFLGLAQYLRTAGSSQTARSSFNPGILELENPADGIPTLGQDAINRAMAMFNVALPRDANWPVFDENLQDRGLTVKSRWFGKAEVSIGPSAFSSWAMLGSTLAHEIEVHCQQNFPMIFLEDAMGLKGSWRAEREAYEHELTNAGRFGLSAKDARLIAATMDFYYPAEK